MSNNSWSLVTMNQKVIVDTSALMGYIDKVSQYEENPYVKLVINATVLEELDKHKDGKDRFKSFKARRALKFLNSSESVIFDVDPAVDLSVLDSLGGFQLDSPDNRIIYTALKYELRDFNTVLMTADMGMKVKAEYVGLDVDFCTKVQDINYKGYRWYKGSSQDEVEAQLFNEIDQLVPNEYVIQEIVTDEGNEVTIQKFVNDDLVDIKIPQHSRVEPQTILQSCLLDLMWDLDVPIKIVQGVYGSGKTYVATKVAKQQLDKRYFDTLLLIRNPIPVENIDIGALPGDKEDKVGSYFKCMLQYIQDEQQLDYMDMFSDNADNYGNNIKCEIPSFLKGTSYDRTMMLVDECEDLSAKVIQMIGTRLGKGSAVCFMGDYKQAESQYQYDNGLKLLIEQLAGNPQVGIITLDVDVRSEVSRIFANLDV